MKKQLLICLLAIWIIAALTACGGGSEAGTKAPDALQTESQTEVKPEAQTEPRTEPEKLTAILDRNGERLGGIDGRATATAADAGILYSVFQPAEYQLTATAEYRFFRAADRQDLLLGSLEDQGYEAVYARTELDGILYTLAVTGSPMDDTPDPLWLLAMDPGAGTLQKYAVSEDGFPYAALAAVDGKLLILNHETLSARCDKLYVFDPGDGAIRELLSFPDDGTASLRSVCAAEDGFCLLRLRLENGSPAELLLDRYELSGEKRSERSLNELLIPAALELPGFTGEAEVLPEFGMMVSGFSLWEGRYLYYENFGMLRAVLDLEAGNALLAKDDLWALSRGGGSPAVFRLDFDEDTAGPEILLLRNGKPEPLPLEAKDAHRLLQSLSHSPGGTWLAELTDSPKRYEADAVLYLWRD